jgi:hypothetical protein
MWEIFVFLAELNSSFEHSVKSSNSGTFINTNHIARKINFAIGRSALWLSIFAYVILIPPPKGGGGVIHVTVLILLHVTFSYTQNKNLFESIWLLTNWRHLEQHNGQSLEELLKKICSSVSRHNNYASTANSHYTYFHISTVLYGPTTCTCTSWVS